MENPASIVLSLALLGASPMPAAAEPSASRTFLDRARSLPVPAVTAAVEKPVSGVLGRDDRRPADLARFPWLGRIRNKRAELTDASATLLSPRLVLSAFHVVINKANRLKARTIEFAPASPLLDRRYRSLRLLAHGGRVFADDGSADAAEDWALFALEEPVEGLSRFPQVARPSSRVVAEQAAVSSYGFPGEKEGAWAHEGCRVTGSNFGFSLTRYATDCDMTAGVSGGPLVLYDGTDPWIIGSNSRGGSIFMGAVNWATSTNGYHDLVAELLAAERNGRLDEYLARKRGEGDLRFAEVPTERAQASGMCGVLEKLDRSVATFWSLTVRAPLGGQVRLHFPAGAYLNQPDRDFNGMEDLVAALEARLASKTEAVCVASDQFSDYHLRFEPIERMYPDGTFMTR